jgi:hypothetical protein
LGSNEETIVLAMLAPIPETESNSLKISLSDFINPNKVCASSLFEGGEQFYKIAIWKQK